MVKTHTQNHFGHPQMTAYPESALSETALAEGSLYFYYHLYTPDLNEDTNLASTNEVITYRKPTGNLMVR